MIGAYSLTRRSPTATQSWQPPVFAALSLIGSVILTVLIIFGQARIAIAAGVAIPLLALSLVNIRAAIRYWRQRRSILALAIMGILAVTIFGWLRGGGYAVDPLVWLCIGSLDRLQNDYQPENTESPPS